MVALVTAEELATVDEGAAADERDDAPARAAEDASERRRDLELWWPRGGDVNAD